MHRPIREPRRSLKNTIKSPLGRGMNGMVFKNATDGKGQCFLIGKELIKRDIHWPALLRECPHEDLWFYAGGYRKPAWLLQLWPKIKFPSISLIVDRSVC